MKPRPVHMIIDDTTRIVPRTWCGVDPCRKGVEAKGRHWGGNLPAVTCKACLRASKKGKS